MKKYWKLLVITIFMSVVLSVYFIHAKGLTDTFPQFNFKTVQGDEEEVNSLVVNGDLYYGMFNIEPFYVQSEGTKYYRDESFINRISDYYVPLEIKKLQQEHRNFMRGKESNTNSFFENEEVLIYATTPYSIWSMDNYIFEIEVLNKTTNDVTSFTVPIPERNKYWYVEPYGVKYNDGLVTMFTVNSVNGTTEQEEKMEARIYTFDVKEKQLINNEVIADLSTTYTENGYDDLSIIFNEDGEEEHVIVMQSHITYNESAQEDWTDEVVRMKRTLKYNMITGETTEIKLSAKEDIGIPFTFVNDTLFFFKANEKYIQLISYNVKESKVEETLDIPVKYARALEGIHEGVVKDNKYYFITTSYDYNEATSILVVDLEEMTLDYIGEMENMTQLKNAEEIEFYFSATELRD